MAEYIVVEGGWRPLLADGNHGAEEWWATHVRQDDGQVVAETRRIGAYPSRQAAELGAMTAAGLILNDRGVTVPVYVR